MASKIIKTINKEIELPNWLIFIIAIVFIFRIPSFYEPFSYGDEMIYLSLGNAIRKGWVLYRDIHDNKPPLLYFLAALAGNVFWFRAILAFWMSATIALFWKLTRKIFPKDKFVRKACVVVFAILTTIPTLEGQIANSEIFMIGPTILGFLLLLGKDVSERKILASGLMFSLATLFKMPAMFDMGAVIFLWVVTLKLNSKSWRDFVRKSGLLAVGFLTPILLTFVWYWQRGALEKYVVAAFLQNIGYLSSFRPGDVGKSFVARNAPLLFRGGILTAGLFVLWVFRKRISKAYLFASSWMLFSLFAAALSERPYPHYLLQVVPSFSILFGMLIANKNIEQVLVIIPMSLAVLLPVYYNFWHYPTFSYYRRFLLFSSGRIGKDEYFDLFEGDINRNYKVAGVVRALSDSDERVFVWGENSSLIYALSRRLPAIKYVATYHINDFSNMDELSRQLRNSLPKVIVILPKSPRKAEIDSLLRQKYNHVLDIEGTEIWKKGEL